MSSAFVQTSIAAVLINALYSVSATIADSIGDVYTLAVPGVTAAANAGLQSALPIFAGAL